MHRAHVDGPILKSHPQYVKPSHLLDATSHNHHPGWWLVRLAHALDARLQRMSRVPHVDDEDLVFLLVYRISQTPAKRCKLLSAQFTKKDAELNVIAVVMQGFENGVATLVIGDIIGDEISFSWHGSPDC